MIRLFFCVFLIVGLVGGCGGKVVVDGDGDPGTPCEQACSRLTTGCADELGACKTQCEQNAADSKTNGCTLQYDAVLTCILALGDQQFCATPNDVPSSCQSAFETWSTCMV